MITSIVIYQSQFYVSFVCTHNLFYLTLRSDPIKCSSRPGNNDIERTVYMTQIYITGVSPSGCLLSYPGHSMQRYSQRFLRPLPTVSLASLVVFYSISTLVGYLIPDPIKIYTYICYIGFVREEIVGRIIFKGVCAHLLQTEKYSEWLIGFVWFGFITYKPLYIVKCQIIFMHPLNTWFLHTFL